jgi:hypothetical protein
LPRRYIWAALMTVLPALASGELYRWTDDSGRVHYSDKPPQDHQPTRVEAPTLNVIETDADTRARNERMMRLRQAQQEQAAEEERQAAQARQALEANRGPACRKARDELKKLSGRVRYRNPDGTLREVSPQEVARDREKVSQWIDTNCAGF